jgi:hypothetical protein
MKENPGVRDHEFMTSSPPRLGDTYLAALLNSWVHVLMYGHYFLTSIGSTYEGVSARSCSAPTGIHHRSENGPRRMIR